jgi:hypothetical protein
LCCLDTCVAFSAAAIKETRSRGPSSKDWFQKMDALNDRMEERVFALLSSLVKMEKNDDKMPRKYEDIYRGALRLKLSSQNQKITEKECYRVFDILALVKERHEKTSGVQ